MNKRITELDAFRGIAAVIVVGFHLSLATSYAGSILRFGGTGVDLFFMISGYVIFLTINKVKTWKDFVISRFARLYPAFWGALLFTIALYLISHTKLTPRLIIGNITMVPNLISTMPLDNSYWTLSVEVTFYALMLVIFLFDQLKNIERWIVVVLLITAGYWVLISLLPVQKIIDLGYRFEFLNSAPLFMAGIVFYKIHTEKGTAFRHVLLAFCFLLACLLHFRSHVAMRLTVNEHSAVLFLYMLLFFLFVNNKIAWIVSKPTLFFGRISYSLYLIHQFFSVNFLLPLFIRRFGMGEAAAIFCAFLVDVAVATLFATYLEAPSNQIIRNYFHGRLKKGAKVSEISVPTN